MKDFENIVKIRLVSRHGSLEPIELSMSKAAFDVLEDELKNPDNTFSSLVSDECFRFLTHVYLSAPFVPKIFTTSQLILISTRRSSKDKYVSYEVV